MRLSWTKFKAFLAEEIRHLATIHPSDRTWQMPAAATMASGLPLLVGAWFDHLDYGAVSSLAGMVFLYLAPTPLSHRMVALMASAFGMIACYAFGLLSHLVPLLMMPALTFVAILVSMVCRFYRVGMPGSLFFIMAASIGAYSPVGLLDVPLLVGLFSMGALLACLIAFLYSIHALRLRPPQPIEPIPEPSFDYVVYDSVFIGLALGISLALAQVLEMEKAYWVPISCLAVIQGASLRAVWRRQLHRILGTVIGLVLAWALLSLPLDKWSMALIMMALSFIIEMAVVRHYTSATVFITPLTILLADSATIGHGSTDILIRARFLDTCLGSFVGLLGGICLHRPGLRALFGGVLRRLVPERFKARAN